MEARLEELRAAAISGARLVGKRSRSPSGTSSPVQLPASRSATPPSRSPSRSPDGGHASRSPPRTRRKHDNLSSSPRSEDSPGLRSKHLSAEGHIFVANGRRAGSHATSLVGDEDIVRMGEKKAQTSKDDDLVSKSAGDRPRNAPLDSGSLRSNDSGRDTDYGRHVDGGEYGEKVPERRRAISGDSDAEVDRLRSPDRKEDRARHRRNRDRYLSTEFQHDSVQDYDRRLHRDGKGSQSRDRERRRGRSGDRDREHDSDRDGSLLRVRDLEHEPESIRTRGRERDYGLYEDRGRYRGLDDEFERRRERERGRETDRHRGSSRDRERGRVRHRDLGRYADLDRALGRDGDRDYRRDFGRNVRLDQSSTNRYLRENPKKDLGYGWSGNRERGRSRAAREPIDLSSGDDRDMRTVFVWQLAQKVREEDVYDLFSRAGRVRDVRLIMDRRSGRHKGQGYVEFRDASSVSDALAMNGCSIRGFPVAVKSTGTLPSSLAAGTIASGTPIAIPQPPPPLMPTGTPLRDNDLRKGLGDRLGERNTPARAIQPDVRLASSQQSLLSTASPPPLQPAQRLVSIEELRKLLNPNNLPVVTAPLVSADSRVLAAGAVTGATTVLNGTVTSIADIKLPESQQVPLPIPGQTVVSRTPVANPANTMFTRLYVGSIPFTVTEEDLMLIFKPFGDILSLQLQREAATGRSRGYGFVEYAKHEAAKKALELNGLSLAGRSLKVNLASSTGGHSVATGVANGLSTASSLTAGSVPLPGPAATALAVANLNGEQAGELDEGREGGVAMNASQRAQLMQRLSRGENMGTLPSASTGKTMNGPCATTDVQTRCLLLSNMFDPVEEFQANPEFDSEVAEDVRDEVTEKYGSVEHLYVDKFSHGLVYIVFGDVAASSRAKNGLHGRWFGGKCISASFVDEDVYKKKCPDAPL